jgi:hypothetical protein
MKLQTLGSFKDHNGTLVPYKLERAQQDDAPILWRCLIDPHGADQWNPAGSGRNHADALKNARQWWQQYDNAP